MCALLGFRYMTGLQPNGCRIADFSTRRNVACIGAWARRVGWRQTELEPTELGGTLICRGRIFSAESVPIADHFSTNNQINAEGRSLLDES